MWFLIGGWLLVKQSISQSLISFCDSACVYVHGIELWMGILEYALQKQIDLIHVMTVDDIIIKYFNLKMKLLLKCCIQYQQPNSRRNKTFKYFDLFLCVVTYGF